VFQRVTDPLAKPKPLPSRKPQLFPMPLLRMILIDLLSSFARLLDHIEGLVLFDSHPKPLSSSSR
jgi:hypothetical protein